MSHVIQRIEVCLIIPSSWSSPEFLLSLSLLPVESSTGQPCLISLRDRFPPTPPPSSSPYPQA